jgi:hypothetical protein
MQVVAEVQLAAAVHHHQHMASVEVVVAALVDTALHHQEMALMDSAVAVAAHKREQVARVELEL